MKTKKFTPGTMQKSSPADIIRMWIRLWGDLDPDDVFRMTNAYSLYGEEAGDKTQISAMKLQ